MDHTPVIVLQSGSHTTRAGFTTDPHPAYVGPSILAEQTRDEDFIDDREVDIITRFLIQELNDDGLINYIEPHYTWPFKEPFDFSKMEQYWRCIFDRGLKVDPAEHIIGLLYDTTTSLEYIHKCTEILFESFNVQGLVLLNAQLAVYETTCCTPTALLIDVGYQHTICVPFIAGRIRHEKAQSSPVGGYLFPGSLGSMDTLASEHSHKNDGPRESLERIKRVWGSIPQGECQVQEAIELLVEPNSPGLRTITDLVRDTLVSIERAYDDMPETTVLLCGGAAQLPGLARRLGMRLGMRCFKVEAIPEPANAAWLGGSRIFAQTREQVRVITKHDYRSTGFSAITGIKIHTRS